MSHFESYDRYKQYKRDTASFVTWLSAEVEKTTPRSKKHNSRRSHNQDGNTMSTRELLAQAGHIASGGAMMPEEIYFKARRAIRTRDEFVDWYQSNYPDRKEDNKSHEHYADILHQALVLLEYCIPHKEQSPSASNVKDPTSSLGAKMITDATNQFAALKVEEPVESTVNSNILSTRTSNNTPIKHTPSATVVELEADPRMELGFKIFCLFRDLQDIRQYIIEIWQAHKRNEVDLVTASLVTNLAIQLVIVSERELVESNTANQSNERLHPYFQMVEALVVSRGIHTGVNNYHELLVVYDSIVNEHAELIYLDVGCYLALRSAATSNEKGTKSDQSSYATHPSDADESHEPNALEAIHEYIEELLLLHAARSSVEPDVLADAGPLPLLDEISRSLTAYLTDHILQTSTVFAVQLLLDIHNILSTSACPSFRCFQILFIKARSALINVANRKYLLGTSLEKGFIFDDLTVINRLFRTLMSGVHLNPHNWIARRLEVLLPAYDKVTTASDEPREQHDVEAKELDEKKLDRKESFPAPVEKPLKPDLLFTANPVLCGTLAHQTLLQLTTAGRLWANGCGAVVDVCHLYQALKHSGLLQSSWTEVEKTTQLHIGAFFGGKLPDPEPGCAVQRYTSHVLGFSATAFSRGKRPGRLLSKITEKQGLIKCNELFEAYRKFYGGEKAEMLFIADLEKLSRQSKQQKSWVRPQESQTQFLKEMREMISQSLADCEVDMVTVTRHCYEVLEHISDGYMTSPNSKNEHTKTRNHRLTSKLLVDLGNGFMKKPKLAAKIMQDYIDKIAQEGEKSNAENSFISLKNK